MIMHSAIIISRGIDPWKACFVEMQTRLLLFGAFMEIIELPIKSIFPYKNNPRHNDKAVEFVANSLRQFGWKQPIVIDEKYEIVAGHTRWKAAKMLGMETVPCVMADDLTPEQVQAYRLADNKTAEMADWDFELLEKELNDIDPAMFDMSDFGFFADGEEPETEQKEIIEDEPPEKDEVEPVCKRGQIWQLGQHRLICGDSTDPAVIDRLMDGVKADMVFTDSPYGINAVNDDGVCVAYGDNHVAQRGKYAKVIGDDTTETAQQAYNIYSQLCDKMILWGGNYFLDFLPPSDGWLIWDKRGESGIRNTFADGEMAWCSFHTPVRIYHQLWNGMIREGEHEKRVHPTQKPIRMLSEILQDFTNEGDIILDVFGGSGSTLIACEQTGRTCYMAELSPEYVDVIIARYEKLTGNKAVLLA